MGVPCFQSLLIARIMFNDLFTFTATYVHILSFNTSSLFQFRLNGKANVIPWNQIFAQGWALRINYDLPENIQKRHQFFKRDIHSDIEDIPDE